MAAPSLNESELRFLRALLPRKVRFITLWLAAIVFASAASGAAAAPASLDPLLESVRATKPVPALAAAVVRRGETVALGAVGFRKDGLSERVTRDDRWHIGSCTKSMTAALAAMLVEEGRMRWDTTLPEMFPALASEMNAERRGVTLEQLLAHRGGVFGAGKDETDLNRRLYGRAGQPPREQRDYLTREVLTHAGSNTMFYTVIWLAPKKDFAVVVCTNLGGDVAFQAVDVAAARLIQEFLTGPERDG